MRSDSTIIDDLRIKVTVTYVINQTKGKTLKPKDRLTIVESYMDRSRPCLLLECSQIISQELIVETNKLLCFSVCRHSCFSKFRKNLIIWPAKCQGRGERQDQFLEVLLLILPFLRDVQCRQWLRSVQCFLAIQCHQYVQWIQCNPSLQ